MKTPLLAAALALVAATAPLAHGGLAGLLTKKDYTWNSVQQVGGMKISEKDNILTVDCDVSGLRKVTVEPTLINSGIGVRRLKHKRVGDSIQITLVTSVLEKGMSTRPQPVDLSAYPVGKYEVEYRDPDGKLHLLGQITLE